MVRNFLFCCCVLAAIMYKEAAAATDGSYQSMGTFAALYSKNVEADSQFRIPPLPSDRTSINSVSWKYTPNSRPQGFKALLCWNNKITCLDITGFSSGTNSNMFTGKSANQPFAMYFIVVGSGQLFPSVYMTGVEIIVNYNILE